MNRLVRVVGKDDEAQQSTIERSRSANTDRLSDHAELDRTKCAKDAGRVSP